MTSEPRIDDAAMPASATVVVVGGGVTGLSTAWWLARSGVDVVVLEAGIVGFGASGRNGGGCTHPFSPLFREEQRLWPLMDELLGYPTEFQPRRIRLAFDEAELEHMRRMTSIGHAALSRSAADASYASQSQELDPAEVRDAVPLAGDNVVGGFLVPFGGHANPHRTVQAYAWAIQDHGGRVLQHSPVTDLQSTGGRVTAVSSTRGTVFCDHVVLAAGPYTGVLASKLGIGVPVATARAEMIVTEPVAAMPYGGVDGNGLYGRQTLRGNLAYGGGPHEWFELDENPLPRPAASALSRSIARRLAELLPKAAHARVIRSWAGFIENTPDGRPVIERLTDPDNVVIATMSSVGFGLSPATGHAIAQLVTAGRCDFADLSSVGLARFDGLDPNWRSLRGWTGA